MSAADSTTETLTLIRDFLSRRGGLFSSTVAALDREVDEAALAVSASCPPDQLRRLLRRGIPVENDSLLETLPHHAADELVPARPSLSLVTSLRQREMGGGGPKLRTTSMAPARPEVSMRGSADLLVGSARLGLRGVFEGHTSSAFCLCFDPNGERLYTGADDHLVKVWDARSGYLVRTLRGHRNEITDVDIHASGSHLASSSNDCTVRVWHLHAAGMPCVAVLQAPNGPAAASPMILNAWRALSTFRPDHQLLSFTSSGHATLWSKLPPAKPSNLAQVGLALSGVDPASQRRTRRRGGGGASSSADAGAPAADGADGADGAGGSGQGGGGSGQGGGGGSQGGGGGSGDAGGDGVLHGWRGRSMQLPVREAPGFEVFTAQWSRGGVRVAVSTTDCVAYVLRIAGEDEDEGGVPRAAADGEGGRPVCVATLKGHQHDVTSLAWASNGARLASGSRDGTARLWRLRGIVAGGRPLSAETGIRAERWGCVTLGRLPHVDENGHSETVPQLAALAWTSDDALLLTASSNGALGVWDGLTGAPLHALGARAAPDAPIPQPIPMANGHAAATGTAAGGADAAAGAAGGAAVGAGAAAGGVGALPFTGGGAAGLDMRTIPPHSREVYVLMAHPTLPNVVLSASYDGSAMVWDVGSAAGARKPLQTLYTPHLDDNNEFVEGRWAADGTSLALNDMSGRLVLYGVALGASSAEYVRAEHSMMGITGGATALATSGEHASAAPFEQYFDADLTPMNPFEPSDPPAGGTPVALNLVAPPNTLLLSKGKQPYAEGVQSAAAAAAATRGRVLTAEEVSRVQMVGAERALSEATLADDPSVLAVPTPARNGKAPEQPRRATAASRAPPARLFGGGGGVGRGGGGIGGGGGAGSSGAGVDALAEYDAGGEEDFDDENDEEFQVDRYAVGGSDDDDDEDDDEDEDEDGVYEEDDEDEVVDSRRGGGGGGGGGRAERAAARGRGASDARRDMRGSRRSRFFVGDDEEEDDDDDEEVVGGRGSRQTRARARAEHGGRRLGGRGDDSHGGRGRRTAAAAASRALRHHGGEGADEVYDEDGDDSDAGHEWNRQSKRRREEERKRLQTAADRRKAKPKRRRVINSDDSDDDDDEEESE